MTSAKFRAEDVAVVIVNWNGCDILRDCLRSLEAQSVLGFETIVVDNASTDDSIEMMARDYPKVSVMRSPQNEGFAGGVNRGIEATQRQLIVTLNNDSTADPDFIKTLVADACAAPTDVGMFQAMIRFSHDHSRLNSTGIVLSRNGHARDRSYNAMEGDHNASRTVFCPTAGAAMYRREMLDRVRLRTGVFDRSYFMYFEDVDLGWRCRCAGYDARYVPEAVVYHRFQESSKKLISNFVPRQCKRNRLRTLLKNASKKYLLSTLPTSLDDIWWLVRHTPIREQLSVFGQAVLALRMRAHVSRLSTISRFEVERRWSGNES